MNEETYKRYSKLFKEKIVIAGSRKEGDKIYYSIMGGTGNYTVIYNRAKKSISCDCKDYICNSKNFNCICKHCLKVLFGKKYVNKITDKSFKTFRFSRNC